MGPWSGRDQVAELSFRDEVGTITAINHKDRWNPKCSDQHGYDILCEHFRNELHCQPSKILLSLHYQTNPFSGRQFLNQSALVGTHGLSTAQFTNPEPFEMEADFFSGVTIKGGHKNLL